MQRNRKTSAPISAEVLEARVCLSSIQLMAGLLTVSGGNKADAITVSEDVSANTLTVSANGRSQSFARDQVSILVIDGGKGDDILENRTSINSTILGGKGNDVIRGGSGNDVLIGGDGHDIINDFAGNDLLDGGSGNDVLQSVSSGVTVFNGGNGNDDIYGIVGQPNVIQSGAGKDRIIVRLGVDVTDASPQDNLIAFDLSETVALRDGTLYLIGGGQVTISQAGKTLTATVNGQSFQFRAKDVQNIAGIGSGANDFVVNLTNKDLIYYGIGGDDVLIGGGGNDLLKGGAGNDIIIGNGGDDDISGDSGSDVLFGFQGKDKLRYDALDAVFSDLKDLLIVA